MECIKRFFRTMSIAVRFGSEDILRDIAVMGQITSTDRDDTIKYASNKFDIFEYIARIDGHKKHTYATRPFLDDTSICQVFDMELDEKTIDILNNVGEVIVAKYGDIVCPPAFMPHTIDVSRIRVSRSVAVDTDGVIFAKLYGMHNLLIATIEVGQPTSVTFYLENNEKTPAIVESRRCFMFVRF